MIPSLDTQETRSRNRLAWLSARSVEDTPPPCQMQDEGEYEAHLDRCAECRARHEERVQARIDERARRA